MLCDCRIAADVPHACSSPSGHRRESDGAFGHTRDVRALGNGVSWALRWVDRPNRRFRAYSVGDGKGLGSDSRRPHRRALVCAQLKGLQDVCSVGVAALDLRRRQPPDGPRATQPHAASHGFTSAHMRASSVCFAEAHTRARMHSGTQHRSRVVEKLVQWGCPRFADTCMHACRPRSGCQGAESWPVRFWHVKDHVLQCVR